MMTVNDLLLILGFVAIIFAILGFIFASIAIIKCLAFERSTHKVMMYNPSAAVGSENDFVPLTEEQKEILLKNSWEEDLIK